MNKALTIINPPFGGMVEPPTRAKRTHFKKTFRFMKWYFTISDCRVKLRLGCQDNRHESQKVKFWKIRQERYKEQEGRCPVCGGYFDIEFFELHHILPWNRFPELKMSRENMLFLCHDCHKNIHCDPWMNIRLMEQKADEMGIELSEKYFIKN